MNTEEIKTAYAKLTADLIDEGHEVLDIARALFAHNTAIQSELETTGTVKSPNASASGQETEASTAASASSESTAESPNEPVTTEGTSTTGTAEESPNAAVNTNTSSS